MPDTSNNKAEEVKEKPDPYKKYNVNYFHLIQRNSNGKIQNYLKKVQLMTVIVHVVTSYVVYFSLPF